MTVRTAVMGRFVSAVGNLSASLFTAGANETGLAKDVRIYNQQVVAAGVGVFLTDPTGTLSVPIFVGTIQPSAVASVQGFFVLDPGASIRISTDQANVAFWASGAVLVGHI